jgi:hypothetical protein
MYEDIWATQKWLYEAETFAVAEPFNRANCHF